MVITIANQKGGVAKTTTAAAIVSGATYRGKRSLAIDLDPQCTLTLIMDGNPELPGAYKLMTGQHDAEKLIQHTAQGDLICGNETLASADSILQGDDRIYALRRATMAINRLYDVIVIDTPPELSTLLINALTASKGVIIPMRAKITSLQGLYSLASTIREIQEDYNSALEILGVLFTEYNGRTNATQVVTEDIISAASDLNIPVFNTKIRQGVAIDEAQIMKQSIFTYAPKSKPTADYLSLLDELNI